MHLLNLTMNDELRGIDLVMWQSIVEATVNHVESLYEEEHYLVVWREVRNLLVNTTRIATRDSSADSTLDFKNG
jgi:hypothetical protein